MTTKKKPTSYCVLSENTVVFKWDSGKCTEESITVLMGSLVHVTKKIYDSPETIYAIKVLSFGSTYDETYEGCQWLCPASRVLPVNEILWPLLEAVPSPLDRVRILMDKSHVKEMKHYDVGTFVDVFSTSTGSKIHAPKEAVIRYKGPITKKGPGTFFGVEILDSKSFSDNDGSFANHRYFNCPAGRGRFVTVNELRLTDHKSVDLSTPSTSPSPPQMVSRHSATQTYQSATSPDVPSWFDDKPMRPSSTEPLLTEGSTVPLKAGDHVVWINDTGQERGVVRWLKWDETGQLRVGVCFYDLLQNFDTEEQKVIPVPALELVKAEDFYGTSNNATDNKRVKTRTKSESGGGTGQEGQNSSKLRRSDSFRWTHNSLDLPGQNTTSNIDSRLRQNIGDLIKLGSSPVDFTDDDAMAVDKEEQPSVTGTGTEEHSESESSSYQLKVPSLGLSWSSILSIPSMVYDAILGGSESEGSSYYDSPEPVDLTVGSLVEVRVDEEPHYGVLRWLGHVLGDKVVGRRIAGIEMEEEHEGYSDGTFNGRRYFTCNPHRAFFVGLNQCRKDSRFLDAQHNHVETKAKEFGGMDCPPIPGAVAPISCSPDDTESLCGKYRGIQGHHNSCYLDATLFSMFAFTSAFDSLLFRPGTDRDIDRYEEVQTVLREEIVNPLREKLFVRADHVMKLRTLMEKLSSVTGLTCEEKDPEEFLNSLLAQILKAEPFLKLSSGQEAYHYQLFVEKDEHLTLPTVQQLFEQSFLASDIKLKQVPSCLIIQMPRFGKSFKMYPRILPSQLLDVTDVIEDSPRQCTVCGKLAEFECKECFNQGICEEGLQSISFCAQCLDTAHCHQKRAAHRWRALQVPPEFSALRDHCVIPRLFMELFAVVCIETSHYVAFVKCGTGSDAPWCFFDSMADRKGEQNGYNIPEVVPCQSLPFWLSEKGAMTLSKDDRNLPEHAKRLLCDAYMCMYQSSEVSMYR